MHQSLRGYRDAYATLGLSKLAASRIDKEIAAGRLRYSDVMPDVPEGGVGSIFEPFLKRRMRAEMSAPSEVAPEALARRRALNQKLYEARFAHPDVPGVKMQKTLAPGLGAGMLLDSVYAPDTSARFVRTLDRPFGVSRALGSTLHPAIPEHLLTGAVAEDPTLNRAILEHELGEASTMNRAVARKGMAAPFASHLGSEPIIRENLALAGDPEALATMAKLRQRHPDDAYVQKLVRQAGGTPDAPIPLHGKQHRAIEAALAKHPEQLTKQTRSKAVNLSALGQLPVSYVPEAVSEEMRRIPPKVEGFMRSPSLRSGLDFVRSLNIPAAQKFIRTGRI